MGHNGCRWLDSAINFDRHFVSDCCKKPSIGSGMPILIDNYNGEPIDWEELFKIKHERIKRQQVATIDECRGCEFPFEAEYEYKIEKKISDFQFSQCKLCNSKCLYCCPKGSYDPGYNVYPVIKDLVDKGYYKPGGEAIFQGGEPTLMENFEELVDLLASNGSRLRILTSAIKFSPKIEEYLSKDKCLVVISIDSGCKETYEKVKLVDKFNIVCENIEKYARAVINPENVMIKYIIIPGVNDNLKEIELFFELMKKLHIKCVAVDIEDCYARKYDYKNISPHIYLIYDYFMYLAKKYKMYNVVHYAFIQYLIDCRKSKPSKLINNRFLYNLYIKLLTDKKKNLEYI